MLTEDKRVIVRIWTSGFNLKRRGESVGHVSIETPNHYMSLWPSREGKEKGFGLFQPIPHEFNNSYQADLKDEDNRPPEVTICLYSLNINRIEEKFNEFAGTENIQGTLQGWTLIGGNRLINENSGQSCSSLAYELLKAGGIYAMISSTYSAHYASIVSPDSLIKALQAAKCYELKYYSETQAFIYKEGEQIANNACTIL